nr:RNA polymerase sigma factor [Candidatus Acidoferrales bacterium]
MKVTPPLELPGELSARLRRLAIGTEMQALEATLPGNVVQRDVQRDGETTEIVRENAAAREFEEQLADGASMAFRLAMSVLRNRADAEDVAQDALLRAYRGYAKLRERGAFRGWLCRITWRLALDKQRGTRRREKRETASTFVPGTPERSVEQMAVANEFDRHLAKAMDELPEKLRQALVLAAIQGHSTREVAEMLDLPEGTVKSRVHLARKQLTEKLQWLAKDLKQG